MEIRKIRIQWLTQEESGHLNLCQRVKKIITNKRKQN